MATERERQWDRNVMAAAHTVWANDDVVAAYVVLPGRPTYRQLTQYRDCERDLNIRLKVMARGGIFLEELPAAPLPPARQHAPMWRPLHDFLLLTEGVR